MQNSDSIISMGWAWNFMFLSSHEGFTIRRRIVQNYLQPSMVVQSHRTVIVRETYTLLRRLVTKPDDFGQHCKRHARSIRHFTVVLALT